MRREAHGVWWGLGYEEEGSMGLYQLPYALTKTILSQIHLKQLPIPKRKRNQCLKWELRGTTTEPDLPRGVSSLHTS